MLGIQVSHFLCKFLRGLNWSLATHKLELNNWVERQATLHNYLQLVNCRAFIFLKSQPGSKFGKSFSSFQSNLRRGIKCLLVNCATEYFDNGEIILPPTIKDLSTLCENWEWIPQKWREIHTLKGKRCRSFVITGNGYFWIMERNSSPIIERVVAIFQDLGPKSNIIMAPPAVALK